MTSPSYKRRVPESLEEDNVDEDLMDYPGE
jgi:hypothetical protein